mgnify:FL=1
MKCRLTNYPLSKNLVYVALQMHRSMYMNDEFYLDPSDHHSQIAEPNCFVQSQTNWYPWLWSRVPQRTDETESGWELYFSDFKEPHITGDIIRDFFTCCDCVFQPRRELVKDHEINVSKKILGCHFRRGDSNYSDFFAPKNRPVHEYLTYIKAHDPDEYCLYLASDSIESVLEEIGDDLSQYDIHFSKYSQKVSKFLETLDTDIEQYTFNNQYEQIIYDVFVSGIVDTYNLSKSSAFIGPYTKSSFASFASCLAMHNHARDFYDITSNTTQKYIKNYIIFDLEQLLHYNPIRI